MPIFRPFIATRYSSDTDSAFGDVAAPPYDVIDDAERRRLEAVHPNNAVRLILPEAHRASTPAQSAARALSEWLTSGILADDVAPALYLYRMGFRDELGMPHQTTGVIGALSLDDRSGILPHEETMPKPLGQQLELLDATRANLSPIYLLSPSAGLSEMLEPPGPPDMRCTDPDGTHHRVWRVDAPALLDAVRTAVSSKPLVVADGHHRYETACKYYEDHPDTGAAWIMAMIVELSPEQLWVRPTHRLFVDADPDDVATAYHKVFPGAEAIPSTFEDIEVAILGGRTVLIGQGSPSPAVASPPWDASGLEGPELLASLPVSRLHQELLPLLPVEGRIEFESDAETVLAATASGRATAAIMPPPVTVDAIRLIAEAGLKMPQKTTFFSPKPRTGAVFRRFDIDAPEA